jgi:hypothetical protein
MANKKEQSVDSIIAAATSKMGVKAPPTGASVPQVDNGQQFDYDQPPITGPIDFGKMNAAAITPANIMPMFSKAEVTDAVKNIDADYGKAFQIAVKTVAIFKVESVKDFCNLVEKIKESL